MTVRAPDVALRNLGLDAPEAVSAPVPREDRKLFGRRIAMIELQDQRIRFSTVHALVFNEIVGDVPPDQPIRLRIVGGRLGNYCFTIAQVVRS
jgi:hypothetical protein